MPFTYRSPAQIWMPAAMSFFSKFIWEKVLWFRRTARNFFFVLPILLVFLSFFVYHPNYFIFPFILTFKLMFTYIDTQIPMYSRYCSVPKRYRNIQRIKNENLQQHKIYFWLIADMTCKKSSRIFQVCQLSEPKFCYNHTAALTLMLYLMNISKFQFLARHEFQFKGLFHN